MRKNRPTLNDRDLRGEAKRQRTALIRDRSLTGTSM